MSHAIRFSALAIGLAALAACSEQTVAPEATKTIARPSYGVTVINDNANIPCPAPLREMKLPEGGIAGTHTSADGYLTVNVSGRGLGAGQGNPSVDWSSNHGVDLVMVKGGSEGQNWYQYDPESTGDSGLQTSGTKYALSHVTFCYDVELDVAKTAGTSYQRDWTWQITKSATDASITIQQFQQYAESYSIVASASKTDSNFKVSGTITVTNPTNAALVVDNVSDALAGATVTGCTPALPATLAGGASVVCTYEASRTDASAGVNTASATSSTATIGAGMASANFSFGSPTTENNECATIADAQLGTPLSTSVCRPASAQTFTGSIEIGLPVSGSCGEYDFTNTATATPNDGGTAASSSAATHIVVENCSNDDVIDPPVTPPGFCTLSQGYFKNHYTGSRLSPTWALAAVSPSDLFYSSTQTWIQVWNTAPAGNAYYVLAHQFMASRLNLAAGAQMDATVQAAYDYAANTFFPSRLPATTNKPKSGTPKADAALATNAASVLQTWIQTNHCSENSASF